MVRCAETNSYASDVFLAGFTTRDLYGHGAPHHLEGNMLLFSKSGKQYAAARQGDVLVLFSREEGPQPTINFVLSEGRAMSWLSFEEFCDLVVEVRQEINRQQIPAREVAVEFSSAPRTVLSSYDLSDLLTCIK